MLSFFYRTLRHIRHTEKLELFINYNIRISECGERNIVGNGKQYNVM